MSRTPLFSLIRRSLRLAQHSLHVPQLVDELVQVRDEQRRLTRREFVASSAAIAAVFALEGCAIPFRSAPRRSTEPVLIIGAGIAGLTAGYRLRQAGVPVRIIEAQGRTGGRMYSLRDYFADGQVAELGGELIDTNHVQIRALAAELGIELDDLSAEDPALATEIWFFGGQRRTEAEVVEAFRPIAAQIERDLATIGGDGSVSYDAPNGAESLDRMSIAEWLDRAGVQGWIRELLDVGYTTEFGLEIDQQSALNFLLMIDPDPDPFRIFGESDERFHVRDGNDLITQALAAKLEDAIELETVLEAVTAGPNGGFTCTLRRGGSSFRVNTSQLLLAIPFTLLHAMRLDVELPAVKRRAIQELGYGTNAKLMIGFSERIWRTRYSSNGSTLAELPYQLTWETSRAQTGSSGILTNFTGGHHGIELGHGVTARADLPGHRRGTERNEGSPFPLALPSVDTGKLCQLPARPVDGDRGCRR